MNIGDLVIHYHDGDIGIITEVDDSMCDPYYVQWADGTEGYHIANELEVLDGNR